MATCEELERMPFDVEERPELDVPETALASGLPPGGTVELKPGLSGDMGSPVVHFRVILHMRSGATVAGRPQESDTHGFDQWSAEFLAQLKYEDNVIYMELDQASKCESYIPVRSIEYVEVVFS